MCAQVKKLENRLSLLYTIDPQAKPIWGVMSAQNMMEHLGGAIYSTAIGKSRPSIYPPEKAAKYKARFMGAYYPFPKNVKMPGTQDKPTIAPPLRYSSMDEATEKLKKAVDAFLKAHKETPELTAGHGYFGDLNMEEWLHFHIKHVEHHLMQFGLLPEPDPKIPAIEKLLYKTYTQIHTDTPAKWGEMSAHQMIEHLSLVFILSTGKFNLVYKGSQEDAKKYWEGFQKAENPWKTLLPNKQLTKPRPTREETIEGSKEILRKSFQNFLIYCEENPQAKNIHFYMGDLNMDQWKYVHVKHLEHHLKQFGVLES